MNTSFLYHAFGLKGYECTRIGYENKSIVLNIQTRSDKLCCSHCESRRIVRNGSLIRNFRGVPIGGKPVVIRMKVQRLKCKECMTDRQEAIHFTTGSQS
jgi:transposase